MLFQLMAKPKVVVGTKWSLQRLELRLPVNLQVVSERTIS